MEQDVAPVIRVVVSAVLLCKQDFSTVGQVEEEATLRDQNVSITSQKEEEVMILIEQNVALDGFGHVVRWVVSGR